MDAPSARVCRSIDPDSLPKHFDAAEAEARWDAEWERSGVYRWDPSRPRDETFVVDTPPPTVSGSLHVGHVFSYTHTDVIVRHQRMRGRNVFYPMGWDDNGLPTERRVQNHFHVRCDPRAPHDPGLALEPATAKQEKEPPRARLAPELHRALPPRDRGGRGGLQAALAARRALGRLAAGVHHDRRSLPAPRAALLPRPLARRGTSTTSTRPPCGTSTSRPRWRRPRWRTARAPAPSTTSSSASRAARESFVIATTRPELLAACVGVTAHPDDARYRELFGRSAPDAALPRAGADLPERAGRPREGHGHPDGLHLRRRHRRALVARAGPAAAAAPRPRRAAGAGRVRRRRPWRAATPPPPTAPTPSSPARR